MTLEDIKTKYCIDGLLKIHKITMSKLNRKGSGPASVSLEYDGKKYDVRVSFFVNSPIIHLPKDLPLSESEKKTIERALADYGNKNNLFSKNYLGLRK